MSFKLDVLSRKYSPVVHKPFQNIELLAEPELRNTDDFVARAKTHKRQLIDIVLWKYHTILSTFIYGNSFIGSDYFLLRYVSHQLLVYWHILSMEQLSDEQIQSCILEIETQFYFFLNCIYNIKEKFEIFTNFKGRHIGGTILLDDCARKLESIYSEAYNHLRDFCKARKYTVHGTYAIKYVREKRIIQVSCFSFTLIDASAKEQEKIILRFKIGPDEILRVVTVIYQLMKDVLELLADLANLNPQKLIGKFIHGTGNKRRFEISF